MLSPAGICTSVTLDTVRGHACSRSGWCRQAQSPLEERVARYVAGFAVGKRLLARASLGRADADTLDDAVAEQAWRQVSRLASRLNGQARTIARTLEGAVIDQRDLVAQSLLARRDATPGREAR